MAVANGRDTVPPLMYRGRDPGGRRGGARGKKSHWISGAGALALLVLVGPARAQSAEAAAAEEAPVVVWSVGAGSALALASMAVGGGIAATAEGYRQRK